MPKIAFFKLFSLAVRVFTRPAYNYLKSAYSWNFSRVNWKGNNLMEQLGQLKFEWEVWFADRLMPEAERFARTGPKKNKSISKELARLKGIDFFWDLLFYFTILGVGGYEAIRTHQTNETKKTIERALTKDIEQKLAETYDRVFEIRTKRDEVVTKLDEKLEILKQTLEKVIQETEKANEAERNATDSAIEVHGAQTAIRERIRELLI